MLLAAIALAVIALAVLAVARTPAGEREPGWPADPRLAAAVVLALPAAVVVLWIAPYLAALVLLGGLVAFWVRARPGRPRAPRPRRRRA